MYRLRVTRLTCLDRNLPHCIELSQEYQKNLFKKSRPTSSSHGGTGSELITGQGWNSISYAGCESVKSPICGIADC